MHWQVYAIKYPNYLTAFFKAEMMKRLLSLTAAAPSMTISYLSLSFSI